MKRLISIVLLLLSFFPSKSQESRQKVISIGASSINANFTRSFEQNSGILIGRSSSFGINPQLAYGKWNSNHLWLFGFDAQYSTSNSLNSNKITRFAFLPSISYQYRVQIVQRIYYSQIIKFALGYSNFRLGLNSNPAQDQKLNGFSGGFNYSPVGLLVDVNRLLNITFQVGDISLNYERVKYVGGQNDNVVVSSLDFAGQLYSLSVAIQFKIR